MELGEEPRWVMTIFRMLIGLEAERGGVHFSSMAWRLVSISL